jgi:uncharacterized protein (DUF488 family)
MVGRGVTVHTVGHSTRGLQELADSVRAHGVDLLVDIRSMPGSARHPQFNAESLEADLPRFGIGYLQLPVLGGRRPAQEGSPNTGWRNKSFRGYADYMQTATFWSGVHELLALAQRWQPVMMCAEAVPWRCHRSLVGDALLSRGARVVDIIGPRSVREHAMTSFARVQGDTIVYPEDG